MNPPRFPRAKWARQVAREFLLRNGIVMPPVDAEALVRSLAEVVVFEHPEWDGFTVYDVQRGLHVVHINVALAVDGRRRFTWAHELGHIVLGHLRDYDCNRLPAQFLRVLDREADIFASELLMPRCWIDKFVPAPCDARSMGKLKDMFGVSWEALIARLGELGIQEATESQRLIATYRDHRSGDEWSGLWARSRARAQNSPRADGGLTQ